jgi:dihydrodipicolinate synthase/N-acetylneuraminate lyase
MNPDLSFFVAETVLASAMMLGARGTYSSLVCTDPKFMLDFYDCASGGHWTKAAKMQKQANRFCEEAVAFVQGLGGGTMDPVFDKGLAKAAGCIVGSQRIRPPYIGWSDATVAGVRRWLGRQWPQFLHPSLKKGQTDARYR